MEDGRFDPSAPRLYDSLRDWDVDEHLRALEERENAAKADRQRALAAARALAEEWEDEDAELPSNACDLRPCPFCGCAPGYPVVLRDSKAKTVRAQYRATVDHACNPGGPHVSAHGWGMTYEDARDHAASLWNRRIPR